MLEFSNATWTNEKDDQVYEVSDEGILRSLYGVTIDGEKSSISIYTADTNFYGTSLLLTLKQTLVKESEWYNTTEINIDYAWPSCPVET